MQTIKIGKFTFLCKSLSDRIAFHHEVDAIYKKKAIWSAFCQYYNRTRERRTFQTCVLDALENIRDEKIKAEKNHLVRYNPSWKAYEKLQDFIHDFDRSKLGKDIAEAMKLAKENCY